MGLDIAVGDLAVAVESGCPELLSLIRYDFDTINAVLRDNDLPTHDEPSELELPELRAAPWRFRSSCLHCLRRFAVYVLGPAQQVPCPVGVDYRPRNDPVLRAAFRSSPELHLVNHSDAEGDYVPVDFSKVIWDERLRGESLGSSIRLLAELRAVAPFLGIDLDRGRLTEEACEALSRVDEDESDEFRIEKMVWFVLFEAAEISVDLRTAISFG